jgi:hypothetical protein
MTAAIGNSTLTTYNVKLTTYNVQLAIFARNLVQPATVQFYKNFPVNRDQIQNNGFAQPYFPKGTKGTDP